MTNTEIQVGKFGRTNLGKILVFAYIENAQGECYKNKVILSDGKEIINEFYYFEKDEKIMKESSNLIDLIEVKDILRIIMCDDEDIDGENPYETLWYIDTSYTLNNIIALIKTNKVSLLGIATHEQFENIEYKVGG